jgi:hypothetical protein
LHLHCHESLKFWCACFDNNYLCLTDYYIRSLFLPHYTKITKYLNFPWL